MPKRGKGSTPHLSLPLRRRTATIVSPLRYPGSKRRLASYISALLSLNDLKPKVFVEPFAGGASVALELLARGQVESIALGEKDGLVASFWKVVFNDTDWLLERVKRMSVTLRQWHHYRRGGFRSERDRARACLFLNRTSFSGILSDTAGPIGGQEQESDYAIDCRFPRDTLVRRITQIAELRDKVAFVHAGDWKTTLEKARELIANPDDLFAYFDPPFYNKADRLYRFFFSKADHKALRNAVARMKSPWLVSYDPAPEIVKLYSEPVIGVSSIQHLDLLYSAAAASAPARAREIVITGVDKMPRESRLWRSSTEWHTPLKDAA